MSIDAKEALDRLEAERAQLKCRIEEAWAQYVAAADAATLRRYDRLVNERAEVADLIGMAKRILADDYERVPTENNYWIGTAPRPTIVRNPRPSSFQQALVTRLHLNHQQALNAQVYSASPLLTRLNIA